MKITKVEVFPVTIGYPEAYASSHGSRKAQRQVIIKIHTNDGLIGLGEAVYRPKRGMVQEVNVLALSKYFAPGLIGENPLEIDRLIHKFKIDNYRLGGSDCPYLSAMHAVDMALYDIWGKAMGVPVYELLGGKVRDRFGLTRSLPVKSPEETAERAVALKEKGYKMLTLKIGVDPEKDIRLALAVKKAVGDLPLEADANEGYTPDTAISTLRRLEDIITGIEQPIAWWDLLGMAKVCRALDMPVIADQSIPTPRHVALAIKLGAADQFCLKLPEQGGFTMAKETIALAKAANIPVSMGSAHPLGVGTAALMHWVAATEWVRPPVGYGSPLERLVDDIVTEPVKVINGEVAISDKPGLGVELDEAKMRKYAVKITIDHN